MNRKRKSEALVDPLIDEVRERRRLLFEQYDYDLDKLFEAMRKREIERPGKVVRRVAKGRRR